MSLRSSLKPYVPWPALYVYRKIYYFSKDVPAALAFVFNPTKSPTSFWQRLNLVFHFYYISYTVDCPHTEHELLAIAGKILNLGSAIPGAIVEAGAYHGGSSAKLSLVARLCDRQLAVFDSFEGMPDNDEAHGKSIYGREHHFPKGSHAVRQELVEGNVRKYGDISRCRFYKGWLKDTLPSFKEAVALACINVDLVQSTKDALVNLYPRMRTSGLIISQDGHFPWIIELLKDDAFWKNEVGVDKPRMDGLGTLKFVTIYRS